MSMESLNSLKFQLLKLVLISSIAYFAYFLEFHQGWGIKIVLYIQQSRTPLGDIVMHFFSLLGFETFFMVRYGCNSFFKSLKHSEKMTKYIH